MRKYICPDCGAALEDRGDEGLRCPWTTDSRARVAWIDGIKALTCQRPYSKKPQEITAPIHGRIAK